MRRALAVAVSLLCLSASADERKDVAKAKEAVKAWLELADAGDGAKTWQTAGAFFRDSVTEAKWTDALAAVRKPLGKVASRDLKSASLTRSLPGAPDGEYVVTQWDTRFAHRAQAVETVTASHEKDGSWRVVGYFVR